MRKAELSKSSGHWLVTVMDDGVPVSWGWYDAPTHAEAMFLAQLLADPARYIKESQAAVWEECAEEYCNYQWTSAGGTPYDPPRSPYWKDKTNDNDNA